MTISSAVGPYKIIEFHPDIRQRIIWEGTEAQGKIMSKQDQSPAGKTQNSGTHVQHLGLMASSMLRKVGVAMSPAPPSAAHSLSHDPQHPGVSIAS